MRLKNYKDDLIERLKEPDYAAAYLARVLEEGDRAAFLIALKDVVEAGGGVGFLAEQVDIKRPSLYKILSKKGNPTLTTLQDILRPLGLRVSVTPSAKIA
ncbi:MAG TPA: addiction module antidote protein [Candidatus Saccharimonadales bacterium]|nr:addiction module antidote protein [Candidatus Saccharimonadales bacterium]